MLKHDVIGEPVALAAELQETPTDVKGLFRPLD